MSEYELRPRGVFHRPSGQLILPTDTGWPTYHAWLDAGGQPDPEPLAPPQQPKFDFKKAGANREARAIERLAKTDPTEALLRKAGLK